MLISSKYRVQQYSKRLAVNFHKPLMCSHLLHNWMFLWRPQDNSQLCLWWQNRYFKPRHDLFLNVTKCVCAQTQAEHKYSTVTKYNWKLNLKHKITWGYKKLQQVGESENHQIHFSISCEDHESVPNQFCQLANLRLVWPHLWPFFTKMPKEISCNFLKIPKLSSLEKNSQYFLPYLML